MILSRSMNIRETSSGKFLTFLKKHNEKWSKKGILLCLFSMFFSTAFGQFYNGSHLTFGKSRVQYQNFNWQYYRNPQFDVYFYPNSRAIADYVNAVAPEMIKEMEKEELFQKLHLMKILKSSIILRSRPVRL